MEISPSSGRSRRTTGPSVSGSSPEFQGELPDAVKDVVAAVNASKEKIAQLEASKRKERGRPGAPGGVRRRQDLLRLRHRVRQQLCLTAAPPWASKQIGFAGKARLRPCFFFYPQSGQAPLGIKGLQSAARIICCLLKADKFHTLQTESAIAQVHAPGENDSF